MKKIVVHLDLHDNKEKQKALKCVATLSGIDSIEMNMKEKKLIVIGPVDPVAVVSKLRKYWHATIILVGPAKEPEKKGEKKEEKKEETKKDETKKDEPKKEEEKKEEEKKEESKNEEEKKEENKKEENKKEEENKKDEPKKEEEKKRVIDPNELMYYNLVNAYKAYNNPYMMTQQYNHNYNHNPPYVASQYFVRSVEDNPNSCAIL